MYAIIATGGKQYKVSEGDVIDVEKIAAEAGAEVTFDNVLAVGGETLKVAGDVAGADITYAAAEEGGELSCRFESPPDEKAALLVDSMVLGLKSVRETYGGEYLVINLKEE